MGDLSKLIIATGLEKFSKVQKIAQSGHTAGAGPLAPDLRICRLNAIDRWMKTCVSVTFQLKVMSSGARRWRQSPSMTIVIIDFWRET